MSGSSSKGAIPATRHGPVAGASVARAALELKPSTSSSHRRSPGKPTAKIGTGHSV
jgi:hypothetical protein